MKFSIRDLLLVTVIVALAVGWGVEHQRWRIASIDAKNRRWECEYWMKKVLQQDEQITKLRRLPNSPSPSPNPSSEAPRVITPSAEK